MDDYDRLQLLSFVAEGGTAFYVGHDLRQEITRVKEERGLETFKDAAKFMLTEGVQES